MKAIHPDGEIEDATPEQIPDCCPVCNMSGTMEQHGEAFIRYDDGWKHNKTLQVTSRCPLHSCGALFIAESDYNSNRGYMRNPCWELRRAYPSKREAPALPEQIKEISPSFIGLYTQALDADYHGLDDVFGMGLRKALEFLIKDYCIHLNPDKAESIKKKFLGQVIKDHVSDPNVKLCAERAVWLGNDETHYERRWKGHDVQDLHSLIKLTINWINSEHLTKTYLGSMSPEK